MKQEGKISSAVIRRLPRYLRALEDLESSGTERISSGELSKLIGYTASQIRQDINVIEGTGKQGFGYSIKELREHLQKIMGLDQHRRIIVLGRGRTGQEIANHPAFADEGFPVVALFDLDPGHLAQSTAAVPVYPEAELEKRVPDLGAKIAVLALPTEKAQEMLNRLYDLGIRAIWSFSRADLHPPRDMAVVNWHLYDTLQILSYRISQMEEENPWE